MAVPSTKNELKSAIIANYEKLTKELSAIPPDLMAVKTMEGHAQNTMMSLHNLVSYLLGWGNLVLKWIDAKEKGLPVDFPETDYKWNQLGLLAQKFYKDYADKNYTELKQNLDSTIAAILLVIERKSEEELYGVTWYDKWTLGRMIQFNTASPYTNARGRIRKWKKENNLR